jgi:cysteinyl-tRNA synthetase
MCSHHLGGLVDIHGGGADLIFPHHENEIAQSEAFLQQTPFARYWVHNGLLQLGGEKMSKSIGNLVPVQELIDRRRTAAFRLLVLQSHYRAPLTYTEEGLEAAERGLDRIRAALNPEAIAADTAPLRPEIADQTRTEFETAMDDDFDTPGALAAIFALARAINRSAGDPGSANALATARGTLQGLLDVLGIDPNADADTEIIGAAPFDTEILGAAPFIELLLRIRDQLRAGKHWAEADAIRNGLNELGIRIEDGPEGATWRKEN